MLCFPRFSIFQPDWWVIAFVRALYVCVSCLSSSSVSPGASLSPSVTLSKGLRMHEEKDLQKYL